MAKSSSKDERKAARKAEKKAAKTGGSGSGAEPTGVTKVKSEKKDKKEKRTALAEKALNEIESGDVKSEEEKSEVDGEDENKQKKPVGALVPFANPLADDKVAKKVFKSVKKGNLLIMRSVWRLSASFVGRLSVYLMSI
jgi:H/ACA ribonucleoprotein complex subunit 2